MRIDFDINGGSHAANSDYLAGRRFGLDTMIRQARLQLLRHNYTIPAVSDQRNVVLSHYLDVLRYDQEALLDLLNRWQVLRHAAHRKCHEAGLSPRDLQSAQGFFAATERGCAILQQMIGAN